MKPDDGRIRSKHVVDIHPLINIIRKFVVLLTKYTYLLNYLALNKINIYDDNNDSNKTEQTVTHQHNNTVSCNMMSVQ